MTWCLFGTRPLPDPMLTQIFDQQATCVNPWVYNKHFDGLMQERCNSIANALEFFLALTHRIILLPSFIIDPGSTTAWCQWSTQRVWMPHPSCHLQRMQTCDMWQRRLAKLSLIPDSPIGLCFTMVLLWAPSDSRDLVYPHSSGLLHWHWGNHMIAPVPVKEAWKMWVNWLMTMIQDHNKTQQSINCVHNFGDVL